MTLSLVTGGAGFIGAHLCRALLAAGDRVRVLDDFSTGRRSAVPPGADVIEGDVADRDTVGRAMRGADRCYHLAAIASVQRSVEDWMGTHRVNLGGTINVLDAAREGRRPVVYASSSAVYGENETLPLVETEPLAPLTPYGADKAGSELHAHAAFAVHGVPSTGLRFFNVFGPGQDPHSPYSGVISIFAEKLVAGQPLTVFGDGLQFRDFIFVADVVRALMLAMGATQRGARVFNVCRGEAVTLLDLAGALARAAGRDAQLRHLSARPGDVRRSLGSGDAIRAALGFVPTVKLEQGLAALLKWIESERALSAASV
ncbi:MAG: NAD-dependent epimerase/dehydratase family protein [Rhodospirillaceae bacterium]|nr:NAD-dependent epimerase/dehydratase family protein [Rhodospirillaceae bacterium]